MRLAVSAGLSALVHVAALLVVGDLWREAAEVQAFRARLELPVRFQPRRLGVTRPQALPAREMEFFRPAAAPAALPDPGLDLAAPTLVDLAQVAGAAQPLDPGARADTFAHPEDRPGPSPTDYGWTDTLARESFELLRVEDLARVETDHASVIEDPTNRRDLTGYVNLTPLRAYGAGSGNVSIDALARYMRDHTSLLVQIRQRRYDFFESENLLRDPIHFLVEGGGFDPYIPDEITRFSERERQLLGRYMREGGFLFIEGSYRYLKEMAGHLEDILGPDGQMYALPASHPLYSAYFGFASGFPGEDKTQERDDLGPSWYYPIEGQVDQPASPAPANLDPGAVPDAAPSRLGLWGVEVNGEVVAVLSDLQLHRSWALSFDTDEREGAVETPVAQYLQVGTNIIVHALLRSGGITPRRSLPVWAETSPREEVRAPTILPGVGDDGLAGDYGEAGDEMLHYPNGTLAVVRSPLGTPFGSGGVRLRVDGQHRITVLRTTRNGVLLRGLPPGNRWLEIEYGDQQAQLDVELLPGQVTTVSLGISRLAFLARLRARALADRIAVAEWFERFDDLSIEEIFLGGEEPGDLAPASSALDSLAPESPAPESPASGP